jgi:hypothetical protein
MALASPRPSLPKGWVYTTKEVSMEVKAKVIDPSQYLMPDAPLLRFAKRLSDLD